MADVKHTLSESDIPRSWYNIQADLPEPLPPVLPPQTKQPIGPADLEPLFPRALIEQEVATERDIPIPNEVREIYRQWRPTPLYRARRWEKEIGTPAQIYYKYEGASPVGSHKANTAVAQAFANREAGVKRITTETGAGQWGSALAMACSFLGLNLAVYMVRISFNQKPYRRGLMETYGASVTPSPSSETEAGRAVLAEHPDSTGSLGIAISEAVELAARNGGTKYALGSVLNHVMLHQTVIGQETAKQLELADAEPDVLIGCVGGGSNFAGLSFPFLGRKFRDGSGPRIVAVEPSACPTLTKGKYAYDFGDSAHLTPLIQMYTLGSGFVPSGFHAGGLRYHGMGPLVSHALDLGGIEALAVDQIETFSSGVEFAQAEGILPAPETNHAIAAARREAMRCKDEGKGRTIVFNLSGHGHFDVQAYMDYHAGKLSAYEYSEAEVADALQHLPEV